MIRQNFDKVQTKLQTRGVKKVLEEFLKLDERETTTLVETEELKSSK